MAYARLIVRAIALSVLTVAVYAVLRFGLPVTNRSSRRKARLQALMLNRWAQISAFILGLKIDASCNAPGAPFLLVSNHLSYLDVVVLASRLECIFVAKKEVESWPIIGALSRSVGTIFVDRSNRRDLARVNAEIARALADGRGVILFVEGTSTRGSSVLPFRSSLLEAAARRGFPVSFAAVSYSVLAHDPPASLSVCWWGDMTFGSHFVGLLRLTRIQSTVTFGADQLRADDRKVLADRLWFEVNSLFVPVKPAMANSRLKPFDSEPGIGVEEQCNAATRW